MKSFNAKNFLSGNLKTTVILIGVLWTISLIALTFWNYFESHNALEKIFLQQARQLIDKDLSFRNWNASHGGVYVPVTKNMKPNPYLKNFPQRDIETKTGEKFTLVNPAFMIRQVYQINKTDSLFSTHLISLKYINPVNKPDKWEEEALREFEKGGKEYFVIEKRNGTAYARLAKAFKISEDCLTCHRQQGYKVGDIRGGISIAFPVEYISEVNSLIIFKNLIPRMILWIISLFGLWVGFVILSKKDKKRTELEEELKNTLEKIELEMVNRTIKLNEEIEMKSKFEQQLNSELHFSNSILDSIPGVLYFYDDKFNFLKWNKSFENITEYTADEIRSMKPLDFFPPDERQMVYERISKVFSEGYGEVEANFLTKSGKLIPFFFNGHKYINDGKEYLLGTGIDITLMKKYQNDILKLNADLEQKVEERTRQLAETNKELGSFSYTVSHDLRAPLRHILGFIELFNNNFASTLNDKGKRYLQIIFDSAKQMSGLIDDLLSFSRIGRAAVNKTPANFNNLIENILTQHKDEITARNIQIEIQDLPSVNVDINLFFHVWSNLISNAVKYTGKTDNPKIEIGFNQSGQETIFFIKDNGAGFDMNYYDKMFAVFQRLHGVDQFEGSGIGLANVKKIIDKHGGKIWAEGKENEGAVFYFSIKNE